MSRKDKRSVVRVVPRPTEKIARTPAEIRTVEEAAFRWKVTLEYIELGNKEWGWQELTIQQFFHILEKHLHRFESTSWRDLHTCKHCHPLSAGKIEKAAKALLRTKHPGIETLYGLSIGGHARIWGYRANDVFYLMWHDPNHTVYKPSGYKG